MKRAAIWGLAVALTAATAGASEDPLIGTWAIEEGATENRLGIMVRIESIDKRGRATGTYCATREDSSIFGFELRPKKGVKTSLKKGVLKFARGKRKYALSMNENGTMRFDYSSKGKASPARTLERSEANGCLARFATVDETATHVVSEGEQGEFIGTWEGRAKNKIRIGIHVASIGEDGQANALYCWTRKDRSMVAFDTGAGAIVESVLQDGQLVAARGKHSYELVVSGEGKLQHTYRKNGKNPRHTTLKRTEPKGCLTRVRMREGGA